MDTQKPPHTLASSTPLPQSSTTSKPQQPKSEPQKASQITAILSRLAIHYYRSDMPESAFKSIIADMLDDLAEFAFVDIEHAVKAHRQNPKSRFFPTPGELRLLAQQSAADRTTASKPRQSFKPEYGESRPILWWFIPRRFWRQTWLVSEIPPEWQHTFNATTARDSPP